MAQNDDPTDRVDGTEPANAGMEKGFVVFKRRGPDGAEPEGAWAEVWSADALA